MKNLKCFDEKYGQKQLLFPLTILQYYLTATYFDFRIVFANLKID